MKTICYASSFVPPEWIAAHSLRPVRVMPGREDNIPGAVTGMCPFVRYLVSSLMTHPLPGGIILTTECDQMRRAADILRLESRVPVFLLNVPRTRSGRGTFRLYLSELRRMSDFFEKAGGTRPGPGRVSDAAQAFEGIRTGLLAVRESVCAKDFVRLITNYPDQGKAMKTTPLSRSPEKRGVPLMITGGPLCRHEEWIFDVIRDAGGEVVCNACENGELFLPRRFDRRALSSGPLTEIASAYFDIPSPVFRPNNRLYKRIGEEIRTRAVQGLIYRRYVWCDTWHAEEQNFREQFDIPVVSLDITAEDNTVSRCTTRIQAFLEILRQGPC